MYLYEIPKHSKLLIEDIEGTFFHIDGMYSYCETKNGEPFHLSASTPMKKVDDHYEIDRGEE